jgi:hypothetical protein
LLRLKGAGGGAQFKKFASQDLDLIALGIRFAAGGAELRLCFRKKRRIPVCFSARKAKFCASGSGSRLVLQC